EVGGSFKPMILNSYKKISHSHKVIFHYYGALGHIRPCFIQMMHDLRWRHLVHTSYGSSARKMQKSIGEEGD
ncbi:hypothetical protein J1N35_033923, partial [Gossypium stocksii]